jgi:hypothetical protein
MISAWLRAFSLAALLCGSAGPLGAQTSNLAKHDVKRSIPPMPVPRPSEPTPAVAPVPAAPPPQMPAELPPANHIELRARVRGCAMEWRSMKESGADLGMTWADFSHDCLAAK